MGSSASKERRSPRGAVLVAALLVALVGCGLPFGASIDNAGPRIRGGGASLLQTCLGLLQIRACLIDLRLTARRVELRNHLTLFHH